MSETIQTVGAAGSGASGTLKNKFRIGIVLTLGKRFLLLLALFPLGGVIKHGNPETAWLAQSLVVVWGVVTMAELLVTAFKPSALPAVTESLTVEAGWL